MVIDHWNMSIDAVSERKTRGPSKAGTDAEVTDGHVLNYLRDGTYPDEADKAMKRRIRSKSLNYTLLDGTLY